MSLFAKASRGPSGAGFDALVRPHLLRLYALAYRFTGTRDDAEDLVQGLLTKLIPLERRLAQVEILGPWLARALYNFFVDESRRRSREASGLGTAVADSEVLEQIADDAAETLEEGAERLLSQRRILAALQRLAPEQRAVVAWHDIEGYSLDELAAAHDLPLGTLKSRLHRARARLRHLLRELGTQPEPFAPRQRVP